MEYDSARDVFRLPTSSTAKLTRWIIVSGADVRIALDFKIPRNGLHLAATILRVADQRAPIR